MTQCVEEIKDIAGAHWSDAKAIIGTQRVTLGPQATDQWLNAPDHLAMVLARYRAAAALIGDAERVIEFGCGEGVGARILGKGRSYTGVDTDTDAISVTYEHDVLCLEHDILNPNRPLTFRNRFGQKAEAVVSLDVIEHIPSDREADFMQAACAVLSAYGVCVIGTPNAAFEHLASPQSRAGHINLYTHERLHALMSKHFRVIQSFGMQDTSIHMGHPSARHYLLMAGIGPRAA